MINERPSCELLPERCPLALIFPVCARIQNIVRKGELGELIFFADGQPVAFMGRAEIHHIPSLKIGVEVFDVHAVLRFCRPKFRKRLTGTPFRRASVCPFRDNKPSWRSAWCRYPRRLQRHICPLRSPPGSVRSAISPNRARG